MAAQLSNGTPPPPPPDLAHLMERVRALEQSVQQIQVDHKERDHDHWNNNTSPHRLHSTIDKQQLDHLSSTSPRSPRFAYSTSMKKPAVPSVFQMPLHYPRFTKADYETMPEWQLDRLLEEYGLPVLGSLREKRQYAMGVFLWKDQHK